MEMHGMKWEEKRGDENMIKGAGAGRREEVLSWRVGEVRSERGNEWALSTR
jgi:hypothetical protein